MSRKLLLLLMSINYSIYAVEKIEPTNIEHAKTEIATTKIPSNAQLDQAKVEFKSYIASLTLKTRDEVANYRKENAKLNRQKRDLYKNLTQDAQKYLAKEQDFKKRYSYKILQAIVQDLNLKPSSPDNSGQEK